AYAHGAEMIVTRCPLCQAKVEIYQGQINKRYGTKFDIPVMYYSQLMVVAYGGSAKDAALNGQVIKARRLEEIAAKPVKR
ncbi:MAG: heterodisulfide reductase, partial [Thiobacillus sp.]|nr:heterodisulfide reductase [Thiobacillus sp.]